MRRRQITVPSSSVDKGAKSIVVIAVLYLVIALISYMRFKA